jgi:methylamine dehydrogenase heavy chain
MHPDAKDGSQKTASKEIWAVDPVAGKVLARSEAEGMGSFTVTPGAEPLLFGTSEEGKLLKFTVGEDYALTKAGEVDVVGFAMHVAVTE